MARLKNRQAFLASLGGGAAVLTLAARGGAQPRAPSGTAQPSAGPSPAPSGTPKPPSAAAVAIAAGFRRFDSTLSDDEIAGLARDLDAIAGFGAALNPKKNPLRNSDEPVTRFAVDSK